jgi:hypothetical protein
MGRRVPRAACSMGKALTLTQGEVLGLRRGEPGHGARVNTGLRALFARCGWPAPGVSDGGSASQHGLDETVLEAPHRASWSSAVRHVVANALPQSSATLSLLPHVQSLCPRLRPRLQQTRLALVLPPKARANGRWRSVRRQGAWGLHPICIKLKSTRA